LATSLGGEEFGKDNKSRAHLLGSGGMNDEIKVPFRGALRQTLAVLRSVDRDRSEVHLIWRRTGPRAWQGEYEPRPSLVPVFSPGAVDWDALSKDLGESLRAHQPEYLGMVGSSITGLLSLTPSFLLQRLVLEIWRRHSTFDVSDNVIETLVEEWAAFVDSPVIPVEYLAHLINFSADEEINGIALPQGVTLKRLDDNEITELYGGPMEALMFPPNQRPVGIHEFALIGAFDEPKIVGGGITGESAEFGEIRNVLNRAILAFRTFKKGGIGFETIRLRERRFCPVPFGARIFSQEHVPFGGYHLAYEELEVFQRHAELVSANLHPSIEMACSRLGDAETRIQARDRIVDAVIGLEAILLAGTGKEEQRGEMRYRFSLNYSTHFVAPEEKFRAFQTAKELYDLRSRIAHGGSLDGTAVKYGGEKVTLAEVATAACETLRAIVKRYLPNGTNPPYCQPHYWERAILNSPPAAQSPG
jgi:hypothetical protein